MTKQEFLARLRKGLSGLPKDDIEERLAFYSEMIEDRMEDGLSEEDAVSEIAPVDEIATQVIADTPFVKIAKERIRPRRRLNVWEIILLALGSPVWLPLILAAAVVILSLYGSLWAVMVSLWAVFASLAICSLGCVVTSAVVAFRDNLLTGAALLGAGLVCAGLSIFMFYGFKAATKGILTCTKKLAAWIKNRFIRKEDDAQ